MANTSIEAPTGQAGTRTRSTRANELERAQRTFSTSVLISAVRCTLTYIVFPIAAPILGVATGVSSTVGIVSSIVGIIANVASIYRFHRSRHRWRWPISTINAAVIVLLTVLLVLDFGNLT